MSYTEPERQVITILVKSQEKMVEKINFFFSRVISAQADYHFNRGNFQFAASEYGKTQKSFEGFDFFFSFLFVLPIFDTFLFRGYPEICSKKRNGCFDDLFAPKN